MRGHPGAEGDGGAWSVGDYVSYVLAFMYMKFANENLDYAICR